MGFLAIPLLPKCSTDLKYGPCPPARDWGSRVSGLVELRAVFALLLLPKRPQLDCRVSCIVALRRQQTLGKNSIQCDYARFVKINQSNTLKRLLILLYSCSINRWMNQRDNKIAFQKKIPKCNSIYSCISTLRINDARVNICRFHGILRLDFFRKHISPMRFLRKLWLEKSAEKKKEKEREKSLP